MNQHGRGKAKDIESGSVGTAVGKAIKLNHVINAIDHQLGGHSRAGRSCWSARPIVSLLFKRGGGEGVEGRNGRRSEPSLSLFFSFFFSFSFFFFSFFNFLFVVVVVVAAVVVVEEYCPSGCKSTDRRPLAAILERLFFFSQVCIPFFFCWGSSS